MTTRGIVAGSNGSGGTASSITFLQAGTGAVSRTVQSKERDWVSVLDFAADGVSGVAVDPTGVVDSYLGIQAAMTASRHVYFPPGTYKISASLTIPDYTHLLGCGVEATKINCTALSSPIFICSGTYAGISGFSMGYSGTPTSGARAMQISGYIFAYENIFISTAYDGLYISGTGSKGRNVEVHAFVNTGLFVINGSNDHYLSQFIINADSATNGANGCVRLADNVQAVNLISGDVLNGVYSLVTTASVYGHGTCPQTCSFTNVIFDSSKNASIIDQAQQLTFTDCAFTYTGYNSFAQTGVGIGATNSDTIRFVGCRFYSNGFHGASIAANAKRTSFVGCNFDSNGLVTGGNGIDVAANATDFNVVGCTMHNGIIGSGPPTGNQLYGLSVTAGTSTRYVVTDNLMSGNVTGAYFDGGTGIKVFQNNQGATDSGRLLNAHGTTVASANNLSLGYGGTYFIVTGTTTINLIDSTDWQDGSQITLMCASGTMLVKYNQTSSGVNKTIGLAGGKDFPMRALDTLTLRYDANVPGWLEVARCAENGRYFDQQGANVASANNLALGYDGTMFAITGTTQINLIDGTDWPGGSIITFLFVSTPVVKHNVAISTIYKTIFLSGSVDYSPTASSTLTLRYDSVNTIWREISRCTI
jgi:hypothetical protein